MYYKAELSDQTDQGFSFIDFFDVHTVYTFSSYITTCIYCYKKATSIKKANK